MSDVIEPKIVEIINSDTFYEDKTDDEDTTKWIKNNQNIENYINDINTNQKLKQDLRTVYTKRIEKLTNDLNDIPQPTFRTNKEIKNNNNNAREKLIKNISGLLRTELNLNPFEIIYVSNNNEKDEKLLNTTMKQTEFNNLITKVETDPSNTQKFNYTISIKKKEDLILLISAKYQNDSTKQQISIENTVWGKEKDDTPENNNNNDTPKTAKESVGWIVKFTDYYINNFLNVKKKNDYLINDENRAIEENVCPPTVVSVNDSKQEIKIEYYRTIDNSVIYHLGTIDVKFDLNNIEFIKPKKNVEKPSSIQDTFGWLVKLPRVKEIEYSSDTINSGYPIVIGYENNQIIVKYKYNRTIYYKIFDFNKNTDDEIEWIKKIKDNEIIKKIKDDFNEKEWKKNDDESDSDKSDSEINKPKNADDAVGWIVEFSKEFMEKTKKIIINYSDNFKSNPPTIYPPTVVKTDNDKITIEYYIFVNYNQVSTEQTFDFTEKPADFEWIEKKQTIKKPEIEKSYGWMVKLPKNDTYKDILYTNSRYPVVIGFIKDINKVQILYYDSNVKEQTELFDYESPDIEWMKDLNLYYTQINDLKNYFPLNNRLPKSEVPSSISVEIENNTNPNLLKTEPNNIKTNSNVLPESLKKNERNLVILDIIPQQSINDKANDKAEEIIIDEDTNFHDNKEKQISPTNLQDSIGWLFLYHQIVNDKVRIHTGKVIGITDNNNSKIIEVGWIKFKPNEENYLEGEIINTQKYSYDHSYDQLNIEEWLFKPPSVIRESLGWIIYRQKVGDVEEDNHVTLMKVMDFNYYNNTIMVQSISPTGEPTGELIELYFDTDKIIWRNPPEKEQSENQLEEATTTPTAVNSLEKQPPGGVVADKCRNCTTDTFKDSFYIYPKDPEATFSISMGAINNAGLMERESYEYKMTLAMDPKHKNELAETNLTYNFIHFDKVYDPLYQFLDIWKFQMNRQLNPAVYYSGSKRNLNYLVEKFHTIMFQNEKAKEMYKSQLGGLVKLIAANPALYFFSATKIEKLASEVAAKGAEKVAEEEKEELTEELNLENLVGDESNDNTDFNDGSYSSDNPNDTMLGVVPGNGGNKKKRGGFFGVKNFHIAEGLRNTLKKVSVKNAVKSIRKTAKNVIGTPFLKTRIYRKLQKFYHFKYDFASTAKDMMASVGNSIGKIFNKEFFTDKYPFFMKREIIYSLLVTYQTFSFLQNKMEKRAEKNSAEMKKKFSDLLVATEADEEEVVEEEVEVELDDKTQTPINKSQEETPAKNGEKKTGTWYSIFNKKKAEMNEEEEDIPPAKIEKETTPVLLPNNEKKSEELNDDGKKEEQVDNTPDWAKKRQNQKEKEKEKEKKGGAGYKITKKQLEARIKKLEYKISNPDSNRKMELLKEFEENNPREKYEKTIKRLLTEKASKETKLQEKENVEKVTEKEEEYIEKIKNEIEKIKNEIDKIQEEIYKENETYKDFLENFKPKLKELPDRHTIEFIREYLLGKEKEQKTDKGGIVIKTDKDGNVIVKDKDGNVVFIDTKKLDENIQSTKKIIEKGQQYKEKVEEGYYKRLDIYEAILDNAPDDDDDDKDEAEVKGKIEVEDEGDEDGDVTVTGGTKNKKEKEEEEELKFQEYLNEIEENIQTFIDGASIQDSNLDSNIKDAIEAILRALYKGVEGNAFYLGDYIIPVFEDKDFEFDTEGYQKSGLVKKNLEILDETDPDPDQNKKIVFNDFEMFFSDREKELDPEKNNKIKDMFSDNSEYGLNIPLTESERSKYITDDKKFKGLIEAIILKLMGIHKEIMMISGDSGDSEESNETDDPEEADDKKKLEVGGSNNITRKKGGKKRKLLKKTGKSLYNLTKYIDKKTDEGAEGTAWAANKVAEGTAWAANKADDLTWNALSTGAKYTAWAANKAAKNAAYLGKNAAYLGKNAKTTAQKSTSQLATYLASKAKSAYTGTKKYMNSIRTVKNGFLYAIEIIFQNTYYAMIDRIAVKINTLLQSEVALSNTNPYSAQENVVRFMSNIAISTIMMPMTSCIIPGTPNCIFATGMSMRMISKSKVITNKYARAIMQLFGTVIFKGLTEIKDPKPESFDKTKFYAINNVFSGKFKSMDPKAQAPPEENPYREDSGESKDGSESQKEYHTYTFELYEYNADKTELVLISDGESEGKGKEKTITVEYVKNNGTKESYVIQEVIPYVYVCPNYYIDREVSVLINNHIETPYFIANIKKDLELEQVRNEKSENYQMGEEDVKDKFKGGGPDRNKYTEMEFEYDNIFLGKIGKVVDTYESVTGRLKNMGASIASSASSLYSTKMKENIAESKTEGRYSVNSISGSGETEVRVKSDVPLHLVRPYNWPVIPGEKEKYKKDIKIEQSHSCFTEEDYSKYIDYDSKNTDSTLQASKNLMPSLFVENAERKEKAKTELREVLKEGKKKAEERLVKNKDDRKAKEEAERLAKEVEEKLKKEAEEKKRLAKDEAERLAKEVEEKLKKEAEAKTKAEEAERLAKVEEDTERKVESKEADQLDNKKEDITKYKDGSTYKGEFSDTGDMIGVGIFTHKDGTIYSGIFTNGKYDETNTTLTANLEGEIRYKDNRYIIGTFNILNGIIPDIQLFSYFNKELTASQTGAKFEGIFKIENGNISGNGTFGFKNYYDKYEEWNGKIENGELVEGTYTLYDGYKSKPTINSEEVKIRYKQEGKFANNVLINGKEINNDTGITSEGIFEDGIISNGKITGLNKKNVYEGKFTEGKMNGEGILKDNNDIIIYQGNFDNNFFMKDGKRYNVDINGNMDKLFSINLDFLKNNKNNVFYKLKKKSNEVATKEEYLGKFVKYDNTSIDYNENNENYIFENGSIDNPTQPLSELIEETEEIKSGGKGRSGKRKSKRKNPRY